MDYSFAPVPRITIVACGTSYYAGMVAKYWLEQFARVPVELDIASEFRYRQPVLEAGGLALFISQSGETADTLAALRHARAQGQKIAVVVNVPTSSMAREADLLLPTRAGPEIGVASTKEIGRASCRERVKVWEMGEGRDNKNPAQELRRLTQGISPCEVETVG